MGRLSARDEGWLWRELALSIRRQRPLTLALEEIASGNPRRARGRAAGRLARAVASGQTLAQSVCNEGRAFSPSAAATIEAGERSGGLAAALEGLAESLGLVHDLRHQVALAVSYPVILALVAAFVSMMVVFWLAPIGLDIIREFDMELPRMLATPIELNIVAFLFLILPASILVLLYVVPPGALPFRRGLDYLRLDLPLIGRTARLLCLSRWCGAMGAMIAAGVPEPEAVRLAGASSGNVQIERLGQRLGESVTGGEPLWRAMALQRFFPRPLTWMLEKAAEPGGHARVWQLAREMYVRQTRHSGHIISLVLRVLLGVMVFQVVAVAAYTTVMPLMSLLNCFSG